MQYQATEATSDGKYLASEPIIYQCSDFASTL
jgi:hypothetical protein